MWEYSHNFNSNNMTAREFQKRWTAVGHDYQLLSDIYKSN